MVYKIPVSKWGKNDILLTSWKEVAVYLECSVRTCISYEKKGLPIHRDCKSKKSRIIAYKPELDDWIRTTYTKRGAIEGKDKKRNKIFTTPLNSYLRGGLIACSILLIILFASSFLRKSALAVPDRITIRNPYDFHIEGSNLLIINSKDDLLWTYNTEIDNLLPEERYRKRFNLPHIGEEGRRYHPLIIVSNFDNDQYNEVIFSIQTLDEFGEGDLIFFDHDGDIKWDFSIGKELMIGNRLYSNDYCVRDIIPVNIDCDSSKEFIVISRHNNDFPSQIILLDSNGTELGSYLNMGRICDAFARDIDSDGDKEIICCGLNNEYERGCLIIFDASNMSGRSPQLSQEFICDHIPCGTQICYFLFPKTPYELHNEIWDPIVRLDILDNNRIRCNAMSSAIDYEFSFDLNIKKIILSSTFKKRYFDAFKSGDMTHALDETTFQNNLLEDFLYWDGGMWKKLSFSVMP